MIQFNKQQLLTKFMKPLFVVIMLISMVNIAYGGGIYTTYGKLTATPVPNESGKDLIYLSTEEVADGTEIKYNSGVQTLNVTSTYYWYWLVFTSGEEELPTTVYCYANKDGYGQEGLWAGWYDADGVVQGGSEKISYPVTPKERGGNRLEGKGDQIPDESSWTQFGLTAKWVIPQVINVSTFEAFPTVTNPDDYKETRTISFDVKDVTKPEHIALDKANIGKFDVSDVTLTSSTNNIFNGTATITVGYTPTGIHSITPPAPNTVNHSGEVVLKSALYEGTYDDPTSTSYKKVIFQVEEDYTPVFSTEYSTLKDALSLGETTTGQFAGLSLESESGKLQPEVGKRNYAAKAPLWSGDIDIEKQEKTTWKATIKPAEGYENYVDLFTFGTDNNGNPITVVNTDNPTVTFTPTTALSSFVASQANETYTFYAKIEYECTYYDNALPNPTAIPSEKKYSYVKATVRKNDNAELAFNYIENNTVTYEYNCGNVDLGQTHDIRIPMKISAVENIRFEILEGNEQGVFTAPRLVGNNMVLSINTELEDCGSYEIEVKAKGNDLTSNGAEITTTESMVIKVNMQLAQPQVTVAESNESLTFEWSPVQGATSYKILNADETEIQDASLQAPTSTRQTWLFTKDGLDNGVLFSIYVVAIREGCSERPSILKEGRPTVEKITIDNASADKLKMQTGMAGNANDIAPYPYSQLRPIDVTAAFDASGNTLFDKIYIFEKTTKNGNSWQTPYYIYTTKNTDGKTYKREKGPINISSSKPSDFKIAVDADNDELYFTGYCPFGATGGTGDNGVLHFIGKSSGAPLNIYLDSLQIYANTKTSGSISVPIDVTNYYPQGNASAIALESNIPNGTFTVNIHLRGKNTLDANKGSSISIKETNTNLNEEPYHYSSPICILPTADGQVTSLTIDDIWKNEEERTNGKLQLLEKDPQAGNNPMMSIDLGNEYSILTINGGQLDLLPIAAAYKTTTYSGNKQGVSVSVKVFGVESKNTQNFPTVTETVSNILLKDGTYNTKNSENLVKFYAKSFAVDGGSYNAAIQHYTSNNTAAEKIFNSDKSTPRELARVKIEHSAVLSNGIANISSFSTMVDGLFPDYGVNYNNYHYPLSSYYVGNDANSRSYGHASVTPKDGKLYFMLPKLECNELNFPWQICSPNLTATIAGRNVSLGGSIKRIAGCPNHNTTKYTIDHMLYMQMDERTKDALSNYKLYGQDVLVDLDENEKLYGTILDETDYTIKEKAYMLLPVEAATWKMFVAPFDVKNIYVIESYPEEQLSIDYGTKRGKIRGENIEKARLAQSRRFMDLYTYWYNSAKSMNVTPQDFFDSNSTTDVDKDGNAELYGQFVLDWMTYERDVNTRITADGNYMPFVQKLQHYWETRNAQGEITEHNASAAHYYLYKAGNDNWTYNTNSETDIDKFTANWTPIAANTDKIMEKGKVYIMQFPHNYIGGTYDPENEWSYWEGKYILIEGTDGPQVINGASHNLIENNNITALGANEAPKAQVFGNYTFSDKIFSNTTVENTTLVPNGITILTLNKNRVEGERDNYNLIVPTSESGIATIAPTEGFILTNLPVATPTKKLKSINYYTGEIEYEKIDDVDPGLGSGLPTIMGDITLIVVPTEQGLTITPIKEQHVMLFDANGKMIFSKHLSAEENVTLPTGVYVVRGEYEQVKAIKK